jgi:hypothetical protein
MRTSFHHQPEAQHPKSPAIHAGRPITPSLEERLFIWRRRRAYQQCRHARPYSGVSNFAHFESPRRMPALGHKRTNAILTDTSALCQSRPLHRSKQPLYLVAASAWVSGETSESGMLMPISR